MSTAHYLGVSGIAERLGVTRHAVSKWRARYGPGTSHPFPVPDVQIDDMPGWRTDRVSEVEHWRAGLPGRGSGGGRPSVTERTYLREARERGFDNDEALRVVSVFTEEFPELTRQDICAWLVASWRDDDTQPVGA